MSQHEEAKGQGAGFGQGFEQLPTLLVSPQEFQVLDSVLKGYSNALLSTGKPSPTQQAQVERMKSVRATLVRNVQQMKSGSMLTEGLAFDEVEVLSEALAGFIKEVSRRVPRSPQREETLGGLRALRERLETLMEEMLRQTSTGQQ